MTTHAPTAALAELLDRNHVPYELLPHRRTDSALDEAEALRVDPWVVAKTIVLTTPDGFVRTVLPASARLDMHKVREVLATKDCELATEATLAGAYPEFELGAVPPISPSGDRVVIDVHICTSDHVILEAGTHDRSLRLATSDLIELAEAELADICED